MDKVKNVIDQQLRMTDSPLHITDKEFFFLTKIDGVFSLQGVKGNNGKSGYKSPVFVDIKEHFEYYHLSLDVSFMICNENEILCREFFDSKILFNEFSDMLVSQFSGLASNAKFIINGKMAGKESVLPDKESIIELFYDKNKFMEESKFTENAIEMKFKIDLCCMGRLSNKIEQLIPFFAEDFVRGIYCRFLFWHNHTLFPQRILMARLGSMISVYVDRNLNDFKNFIEKEVKNMIQKALADDNNDFHLVDCEYREIVKVKKDQNKVVVKELTILRKIKNCFKLYSENRIKSQRLLKCLLCLILSIIFRIFWNLCY